MIRRRCREPGCITFLSDSNPGPVCYAHQNPWTTAGDRVTRMELAGAFGPEGLDKTERRRQLRRRR